MTKPTIGFIGQGWIGKNYADDFEARGLSVVRYALEEPYVQNKDQIKDCDIVFIAVPTPTRQTGFDASAIRLALPLIGKGKTAIIKSTILPGTTIALQEEFPDIHVLNSPEFLREETAAYDAAHPQRNIIGIPKETKEYQNVAEEVLSVLPEAPYTKIMHATSSELVKYAGNTFLALKVVYANILHDLTTSLNAPYDDVRNAVSADPRIGPSHLQVISASGHSKKTGRGAGGHCFIKDLETFRRQYAELVHDQHGDTFLKAVVHKNNALLIDSEKDLDLLTEVYGPTYDVLP
jgi:nucleotide sugar dehydrogenase